MKGILAAWLLLLSVISDGQNAADSDFDFMATKIKEAYAGFSDKTNPTYFDSLVSAIRQTLEPDSFVRFSRLTGYFKDDHCMVFQVVTVGHADSLQAQANLRSIAARPNDAATGTEGYWMDDLHHCILYLMKGSGREWRGYVIESRDSVPAGYEVLKLTPETGATWTADYKDMKGPYRVITSAVFPSAQILLGRSYFKFRKIGNYVPGMLTPLSAFTYDPSITALDSETVLLRMPDFGGYMVGIYDSLIKTNKSLLSRARTLIIDVRDNPGGTIRCFLPLFPYVCTEPMRDADSYQLCSDALIEDTRSRWQRYKKMGDTARSARALRLIDTLERSKGSFRLEEGWIFPCDPVPNHVRHVALLVNHGSRSAAELLILYLRQSKKARIFGENSGGAIDYLDEISYWLPHTNFQFWIASVKRKITPDQPLYDSLGMPPDVRIGEGVTDWPGWVRAYYAGGGP